MNIIYRRTEHSKIGHIRILTVGLERALNGGLCGGIFSDAMLVPVQP